MQNCYELKTDPTPTYVNIKNKCYWKLCEFSIQVMNSLSLHKHAAVYPLSLSLSSRTEERKRSYFSSCYFFLAISILCTMYFGNKDCTIGEYPSSSCWLVHHYYDCGPWSRRARRRGREENVWSLTPQHPERMECNYQLQLQSHD